ncbi:MAG: hypothetical protein JWQ98_3580 [Chlorobi bacterium]|nr:hypothetical protein [Chlorobiota bacterium]
MALSPDTENVLNYLDHASGQGLRKRNDMGTLLELAAETGDHEKMNRLIFHGRHLHNLYTTLRKAAPGGEGYSTLEREFSAAVETIRDLLALVLVDATPEQIERFNAQYYAVTQGSLRNLIDLAHDLGVLKTVQNDRKYNRLDEESSGGEQG